MAFDPAWAAAPDMQDFEDFFSLDENCFLSYSGRSAFATALDEMIPAGRHVLVPDFICGDVMLPRLRERRIDFKFYPVSEDLGIDRDSLWPALRGNPAAIVLVNYFGLCDWAPLAERIRASFDDILIIADNVQAMYDTSAREWADVTFSSFRKFLSVPDGAITRMRRPVSPALESPDNNQALAMHIAAASLRHAFLNHGYTDDDRDRIEKTYLKLFADASRLFPSAPMSMSRFSRFMINKFPLQAYAEQRTANYRYLAARLDGIEPLNVLRPEIADAAVPMALPVLAPDGWRDGLLAELRGQGIFCPVHWPLAFDHANQSGPGCQALARQIFSVPIDQRYDPPSLERVAVSIEAFCEKREN